MITSEPVVAYLPEGVLPLYHPNRPLGLHSTRQLIPFALARGRRNEQVRFSGDRRLRFPYGTELFRVDVVKKRISTERILEGLHRA